MSTTPPSTLLVAYTDGACSGNPGPGGWGVRISAGEAHQEAWGGDPMTTNNRMELLAVIEALERTPHTSSLTVFSDSQYVVKGVSAWLKGWKRNGWRTSQGAAVKNVDLWQRLDALTVGRTISWRWVKGHNGDPGNEAADALARKGLRSAGTV